MLCAIGSWTTAAWIQLATLLIWVPLGCAQLAGSLEGTNIYQKLRPHDAAEFAHRLMLFGPKNAKEYASRHPMHECASLSPPDSRRLP